MIRSDKISYSILSYLVDFLARDVRLSRVLCASDEVWLDLLVHSTTTREDVGGSERKREEEHDH